jgi:hypothetical protein
MLSSQRWTSTVLRVALLVVLSGGLCLFAIHHHEGHTQDNHCAVCHLAAGLFLPATAVALWPVAAVRTYGNVDPTFCPPLGLYLASPCGLRAPPSSS